MRINCEREFDRTDEECLDCGVECDACGTLVCWNEQVKSNDHHCFCSDDCCDEHEYRSSMTPADLLREVGMSERDFF